MVMAALLDLARLTVAGEGLVEPLSTRLGFQAASVPSPRSSLSFSLFG